MRGSQSEPDTSVPPPGNGRAIRRVILEMDQPKLVGDGGARIDLHAGAAIGHVDDDAIDDECKIIAEEKLALIVKALAGDLSRIGGRNVPNGLNGSRWRFGRTQLSPLSELFPVRVQQASIVRGQRTMLSLLWLRVR